MLKPNPYLIWVSDTPLLSLRLLHVEKPTEYFCRAVY
jgi:hypothetical protein